jgi:hypothetical protein
MKWNEYELPHLNGMAFMGGKPDDDDKDEKVDMSIRCDMGTPGCTGKKERNWRGVEFCPKCGREDFSRST